MEQINFIASELKGVQLRADRRVMSIMDTYDLGIDTVINLCGGVPSPDVSSYHLTIDSRSDTSIQCTIVTNLYKAIRRINFGLRVVFNEFLEVQKTARQNGLGTKLLCNQVREGRNRRFRRLDVIAAGPDGGDAGWQGYYTWGRLGFQMDPEDHEDLMMMLARIGRPETCLWELLRHSEGQDLWRRDGFTWHGSFELHERSQSLVWLKRYLGDKNKDYEF